MNNAACVTVYRTTSQRAVQPIKGVRLTATRVIAQYCADRAAAAAWVAKQARPDQYTY